MSRVIKAPCVQIYTPGVSSVPLINLGEQAQDLLRQAEERAAALQSQAAAVLSQAEERVQALLAQAREDAAVILHNADLEATRLAEQIRCTAQSQGYQEGWDEAIAKGRTEASQLMDQAGAALRQAEETMQGRLADQEQELVDLALAIARKVICHELTTNEETILSIVSSALGRAKACAHVILRIAPGVLEQHVDQINSLKSEFRGVMTVDCIGDPLLDGGAILIDTPFGSIDASLDAQLDALRTALHKVSRERLVDDA